jgi:hypothetical protein
LPEMMDVTLKSKSSKSLQIAPAQSLRYYVSADKSSRSSSTYVITCHYQAKVS